MTSDPQKIAREYFEIKKKINELEKIRLDLKKSLFEFFDNNKTDEIIDNEIRVYRVNIPRVSWDEGILESILSPKGLWSKVLSVNNSKVKELVKTDLVL
ncbi:MAG: hypothetical protein PQ975_11620 [Methanobacterium sp.]